MIISINKKIIRVEVNASTLIIYEDRFKGRRLLQDISELTAIKDSFDIPFALTSKLLWAAAKTADNSTPDFYEWIKQFTIADVLQTGLQMIPLYVKDIETVKKPTAAVRAVRIFQRFKFWLTRPNAD
ncbi:MAG: hypothetical protein Q3989_08655 [Eubacteriales bacterium]|nr:hypothetical protein [Eubacteriales bacterium]